MKSDKLAFYSKPFPRVTSYYDMVDLAVQYNVPAIEGFNHMELAEPNLEQARLIRKYADAKGITCCCFSVFADIVSNNAEAEINRLKGFADVAAILGSPYLHHTIAPRADRTTLLTAERDRLFYHGVTGVQQIFDYAKERQVRAVYEDQAFLFNGVENFARFLHAVDRNIGIVADVGNIGQMDETIEPFIQEFSDWIVHVHLKDMKITNAEDEHALPTWHGKYITETEIGSGMVDIAQAIRLLREKNYNGYFALEYSAPYNESSAIDDALSKIRLWLE